MKKKVKLILVRHGESEWNKLNLFTGWVDVPLSREGVEEALKAGEKIKNIPIDVIFTSSLIRAQMTLFLAMLGHESHRTPVLQHPAGKMHDWAQNYNQKNLEMTIPVYYSWHLNERMYGELQGLNKQEVKEQYGEEQFKLWRRSYETSPPSGESLKMTSERTWPYFKEHILPFLKEGKNVFVAAHGNSLRAIVMHLENLSKESIVALEIPTGEPLIYTFDGTNFIKDFF